MLSYGQLVIVVSDSHVCVVVLVAELRFAASYFCVRAVLVVIIVQATIVNHG